MAIVIVGMLDEREEALELIRDRITRHGHRTCLIDISVGSGAIVPALQADVTPRDLSELVDRGSVRPVPFRSAIAVSTEGLKAKIRELRERDGVRGIIAVTGMTGALISLPALLELPFGIPKILISGATAQPVHAAEFGDYFSRKDITVMHSVVDTVGMNPLVRALCLNGADAICGMVEGGSAASLKGGRPVVAVTEFGYCDRGAYYLRRILQGDFEVVSIHAMGMGDRAALDLTPEGVFGAFIDLMPGSFSEHVLGGNRDAGPDRLDVAADLAIPYVFCPGGFDMISCGPPERKTTGDSLWKSRRLGERRQFVQPPRVQVRTSAAEMEETARSAANRLNRYNNKARVKAVIPLGGFSSLSVQGGPLHDPPADAAFVSSLRSCLDPEIEMVEVDADINSPVFAEAVAEALSRAFREVEV